MLIKYIVLYLSIIAMKQLYKQNKMKELKTKQQEEKDLLYKILFYRNLYKSTNYLKNLIQN